jgi:hypothetical protein
MRIRQTSCAISLIGVLVCASTVQAAPQQPAQEPANSVQHVREQLDRPQAPTLKNAPPPRPLPTFRTNVDGHEWVLSLEEQLHKEFDLTPLQRQSADWSARCCGINLIQVAKGINQAVQESKERRIRGQVARELAEIEAARAQAAER